ncbi:MAG: hypothetical protein HC904_11150 [Blastochloris sp.]|nr:hypothetical protein [Blastochloris sp.]
MEKIHPSRLLRRVLDYSKLSFFPNRSYFQSYGRQAFRRDLTAAMNVAVLAFPQGIAFSLIAGLPLQYGVYASAVAAMVAPPFWKFTLHHHRPDQCHLGPRAQRLFGSGSGCGQNSVHGDFTFSGRTVPDSGSLPAGGHPAAICFQNSHHRLHHSGGIVDHRQPDS